ncbi:toxin HipA [Cupriavidus sp. TA19]|uniref:type II toxin-antitoxin system HipA family toxin n=1 Tax=unclassified Cupriavidus TaxID=2640874 RepID=UPI0027293FA3|nr:type II toxin-antitoxin system HipA family toxin [Cupriavidus sp. TA19]GLC97726.1 toxin HipA [Cupriavidus sp. TA19]
MATFKPVEAVNVEVWGKKVGAVARDPDTGFYAFEYEPRFANSGVELAPLQMPLAEASEPFIFPSLSVETYQRLPAMIADALPDKFGNALINAWMADRGMTADSITALDRLAYMGQRTMGALVFKPNRGPVKMESTALELSNLVQQARSVIQGDFKNSDHAGEVLRQIIQVGTSAGGARAKATIAWNPATQEVKTGQFEIPAEFDAWLLKFDGIGSDEQLGEGRNYGRIEYAYSLMAKEAGITMSDCRLLEEEGRAHFMTKRFDRDGNERHHMQTLCAMAHLDFNQIGVHSYNQLFQTIQALGLGRAELEQTLRRMIFNVLAANHDDHTKNFSFLLKQGGPWELAPAYDVTFAFNPSNKWLKAHLMSVNGKFDGITEQDFREVADRYELLGVCKDIVADVRAAVAKWPAFAAEAGVPAGITQEIRLALDNF